MTINLNQLRCFYMAAKHNSVTIAAEKSYVSPPAVSMQIKKLEKWLDFKLFSRDRNIVGLTKKGRSIYKKAAVIFNEVEKLEHDIEDMIQTRSYEIAIGAHHVAGKYIIPDLIDHFHQTCPNLNFRLVIGYKYTLIEKLLNNKIQLALVIGNSPFEQIKTVRLFKEPLVLISAKNSKLIQEKEISCKRIEHLPLLVHEKGTGMSEAIMAYLNQNNISPDIIMDNLSSDIIRQFVIQDDGVAFIPQFAAQKAIKKSKLQIIKLQEGSPEAVFNLAFLKKKDRSSHIRQLILSIEKGKYTPSK